MSRTKINSELDANWIYLYGNCQSAMLIHWTWELYHHHIIYLISTTVKVGTEAFLKFEKNLSSSITPPPAFFFVLVPVTLVNLYTFTYSVIIAVLPRKQLRGSTMVISLPQPRMAVRGHGSRAPSGKTAVFSLRVTGAKIWARLFHGHVTLHRRSSLHMWKVKPRSSGFSSAKLTKRCEVVSICVWFLEI